jgi:FAD dependent oxidoreductase
MNTDLKKTPTSRAPLVPNAPFVQLAPEIIIVGASLGGVMAAYRACMSGRQVTLIAQYDWLGGQLTAQAVPPDEHRLIEWGGATQSYMDFRREIRDHYRQQKDFVDHTELTEGCNPGDGWASRLCFEPRLAHEYFEELLAPFIEKAKLKIFRCAKLTAAKRVNRRIESVTIEKKDGTSTTLIAPYFLDATDTGELIKLAGISYRVGKESQAEFDEPDAPREANPLDQQPVTFVMALKHQRNARTDGLTTITQPRGYNFWQRYKLPSYEHPLFGNECPGGQAGESAYLPWFAEGTTLDWWRYRRIVSHHNWQHYRDDVSLVNWAQNDYALQPLLDGKVDESTVVTAARSLSKNFLFWLQTEAPRHDAQQQRDHQRSEKGYPELQLATDILGTDDGFAQQVYVRESRRIIGLECLSQNDILYRGSILIPAQVSNSVGIAWYNMDIHPTCISGHRINTKVRPFCLPLGCFIPNDCDNLIPACKNISVTHLANAATRVHPVEWLIGEVAGLLAHFASISKLPLTEIHRTPNHVAAFQRLLAHAGVPTEWNDTLVEHLNMAQDDAVASSPLVDQ